VRKAKAIRRLERLGFWLHGLAGRTAARIEAALRRPCHAMLEGPFARE
jgi:hypothetical protein